MRKRYQKLLIAALMISMTIPNSAVDAYALPNVLMEEENIIEETETTKNETASLSEDAVSGDTVSEDAISEDVVSEDTVSGDTVSENTISEDALPTQDVEENRNLNQVNSVSEDGISANAISSNIINLDEIIIEEENYGYHQLDIEVPRSYGGGSMLRRAASVLPSSYSSVAEGYITSVKNQGEYSTCWTFAAVNAAESYMIKHAGGIKDETDYSERQLAYFFYNRKGINDPLGNTLGDYTETPRKIYEVGSNNYLTMWHLAGWCGLSDEEVAPYTGIPTGIQDSLDSNKAYGTNATHLQAVYNISSEEKDTIKRMIMDCGAVAMSYKHDSDFYNSENYAYFNPGILGGGHAVSIVGWDDNFDKNNFNSYTSYEDEIISVQQNGAWLIKNSWGIDRFDEGYMWMSYEDASLGEIQAYRYEPADNYDNNYFYDGGTGIASTKLNSGDCMGNVFEAKADGMSGAETIEAVSVGLASADVTYALQIYRNPTKLTNPASGEAMLTKAQTGVTTHAGYYTIKLDTPITVNKGDKFAVVFQNTKNEEVSFYVDKDYEYKDAKGVWISGTTSQNRYQSYLGRSNGSVVTSWIDLFNSNITARIHAFTSRVASVSENFYLSDNEVDGRHWYLQNDSFCNALDTDEVSENQLVITIDDIATGLYAEGDSNSVIKSVSMEITDGDSMWFDGASRTKTTFIPRVSDNRYVANVICGHTGGDVKGVIKMKFKTSDEVPSYLRGETIKQDVTLVNKNLMPSFVNTAFKINRGAEECAELSIALQEGTTLSVDSLKILGEDAQTVSGLSIVSENGIYYIKTTEDAELVENARYYISGIVNDGVKDVSFRKAVTITVVDIFPTANDIIVNVPKVDYFYHLDQEAIQFQMLNGYKMKAVTMEPYSGYTSTQKEVVNDNFGLEEISENGIVTGYRIVVKKDLLDAENLLDHKIVTESGFLNKVDFKIMCEGYHASYAVTKTVALDFVNGKSKVNTERLTFRLNNYNPVNRYSSIMQITSKNDPAQSILDVFGTDISGNCSVLIPSNEASQKIYRETVLASYVAGTPIDTTKGPLCFAIEPKDAAHDNRFVISASKDMPIGTYTYKLIPKTEIKTGSGIHRALDSLDITVKIEHVKPEVKLQTKTLTLSGYHPSVSASTAIIANTMIEYEPYDTSWITKKSYPKASVSGDDVSLWVKTDEDIDTGKVYVNVRYGAPAGTYKFQITPRIIGVNGNRFESGTITLNPVTLSVTIKNVLPKVALSQKSFTVDNAFCEQEYRIEMNALGEFDRFADSSQIYRKSKGEDTIVTTPLSTKEPAIRIVGQNIYVKMNPDTMKGTYRYYIAPAFKIDDQRNDITQSARKELVIKVTSTRPKAIPSKKVIKLERLYAGGTEGSVQFSTKTTGLEFVDYEVKCVTKPKTASGNEICFEKDEQNNSTITARLCESNAPDGSYKFSITPKVAMKIRGVQYGNGENAPISLAPTTITVRLSSNVPKFKMETSKARIYRKYGNVSRLRIMDSLNALADDAQKVTYYLVKQSGKFKLTLDASLADTAYAIITSEGNGDIVVQKGANINSLTKTITITNLTVSRTLKLKQNAVSTTPDIVDKRKISISIYPEIKEPVLSLSKSKMLLNRYFDFNSEGLSENRINVYTTAAAEPWSEINEEIYGAYLTDCSAKVVKAPRGGNVDDLQVVMDYESGNKNTGSVMLRAVPKEGAVMGEYRVEVNASVNEYPIGHPDYVSANNVQLTKKICKIRLSDTKQKVTYSTKKVTMNRYEKSNSEVIELSIPEKKRYSIEASEIELIRYPKGNLFRVWVTQESEDGSCYLAINHSTLAAAGNYEFIVTPKVTTTSGDYTAARQKIVVKIAATYPKATLMRSKMKISMKASKSSQPSANTKVIYSGSLADQIENVNYTYQLIGRPKKEKDFGAITLQIQKDNITALCRDKDIELGTYKFRLTPNLYSGDVAYPRMKPINLTVVISK